MVNMKVGLAQCKIKLSAKMMHWEVEA